MLVIDKSTWPDGPWLTEPDEEQWTDPKTGLLCLIGRACDTGHLCGYVGVPKTHKLFGASYEALDVEVHGGLTYARSEHRLYTGTEKVWWFGFDCAHAWDEQPNGYYPSSSECAYRTFDFVRSECTKLAAQLME